MIEDPAGYDQHIRNAVKAYSRKRPRRAVTDMAATGAFDYGLPEGWVDGTQESGSSLVSVEYPADQRPPSVVLLRDIEIYRKPGGPVLRFRELTPDAGVIRVEWTAPHTIDEEGTTVPESDFDTVAYLATAAACEELASFYANQSNATAGLDQVDHGSKSGDYAKRAQRFAAMAATQLPDLEAETIRAAGAETSFAANSNPLSHTPGDLWYTRRLC